MSSNADYSFQQAIDRAGGLIVPNHATFIGVGAFGSWAAFLCARIGVPSITLINPSARTGGRDIEGRSIACGPYRNEHFGVPKVHAVRQLILEARPDAKVTALERAYDPSADVDLLKGVVFNGVSDVSVHRAIWTQCRELGLRCVSGIYGGIMAGVLTSEPGEIQFDLDAPVWTISAAMAGSLAVHAACTGTRLSYFGDLSDISLSDEVLKERLARVGKAI